MYDLRAPRRADRRACESRRAAIPPSEARKSYIAHRKSLGPGDGPVRIARFMGREHLKSFDVSWDHEPEREPSRLAALSPQPRARSVPLCRSWSRAAPGDRARSGCDGSWKAPRFIDRALGPGT